MISRSGLESSGAEGGGYLRPGDWTATTGYRHVYSHVHFSGATENFSRSQLGTEVQSKTNLEDLMVAYQLTAKLSLTATLPFLSASRRQQAQYGTLHTSGISDVSAGANYWLRSPTGKKAGFNNAQIGLALLAPTGKDRESNLVATAYGATPTIQYPDYSVQPGGGSWGMIMSGQVFQSLGNNTILFADGDYVMTQGGYHNFWTSHGGTANGPPAATKGLTQFDAIQNQYMLEIGVSHPAPLIKGLGMTFTVRDEGVPVKNLIGNDLGFRRPGFGIALTPGFIYTRGNNMLQFTVGKVIFRDRQRSVPEQINGSATGDAAFANYVWMAGYTLKMPGKKSGEVSAPEASTARLPESSSPAAAPKAEEKDPNTFKPFALRTIDGKKKTLGDFSNKATLVTFFFPRCPFCNAEMPEIQKIYDRYKDKGLSAVLINILPEEARLVEGWQIGKGVSIPVLVGGVQEALQKDYRIESTPVSYVLGPKGQVLYRAEGYKPGDEKLLEAKIADALAPPTAPPPINVVSTEIVCLPFQQ